MRSSSPLLLACALLALGAGCYARPGIPRDKPLTCMGVDAGDDCPSGMACIRDVCALMACASDDDCPEGFTCSSKNGCGLPGSSGGGASAGGGGDGGIVIAPPFEGGASAPVADGSAGVALDGAGGTSSPGDGPTTGPALPDGGTP